MTNTINISLIVLYYYSFYTLFDSLNFLTSKYSSYLCTPKINIVLLVIVYRDLKKNTIIKGVGGSTLVLQVYLIL